MSGAAAAAPEPLVLVVPNFSEGRRAEVMDAIVAAMTSVPGITLLNRQSDPDHNRLDATLIGSPEAAGAAAMAGAAKAVELIDMEQHHGSHPRMGAVDVIPFIPIRGVTMDECVELARRVARELSETLSLPVYLYERAAATPERASLADVRRGEYEGLRADVAEGRRLPDMGPHHLGKAGATAVGARPPLVAFNVYLSGSDEHAAKAVAKRVRERSGGLVHVRAIGFAVPERGCVQVSMNLLDPLATPPYRALELVRAEAAGYGMRVLDTEIVGLIPQAALAESAAHYLQLRGFKPDAQVIETLVANQGSGSVTAETHLAQPGDRSGASASPPGAGIGAMTVDGFLEALASARPTPGGGAAAAMAGAAGAALLAMVARLTSGRKGYEALERRMTEVAALADGERAALAALADRDAAAFDAVMAAHRLPRRPDEEREARAAAVQSALTGAAEVPLEVARRAAALLPTARELVETGNANAVSDAYSAGQLLHTAVAGGLANVSVNLAAMSGTARTDVLQRDAERVRRGAAAQLAAVEAAFASRLASPR
jgi:glutamate formiminotransferase/formiminotetrahydrofolate cyclodeaminase